VRSAAHWSAPASTSQREREELGSGTGGGAASGWSWDAPTPSAGRFLKADPLAGGPVLEAALLGFGQSNGKATAILC